MNIQWWIILSVLKTIFLITMSTSTSALLITPKLLTVWITTNCGKFLKRWEYHLLLLLLYRLCQSLWLCNHNKLWKILQQMGIPDHLTCLLRNLYAGQEVTVRTGYGTTDWFQIGKGVRQGCILLPWLFYFYAEYIMRNAGIDGAQVGVKIARRNISNLRYTDDTTLMEKVKRNWRTSWWKWKRSREVKKLA